jgi:DNA-binding NtrC family response regulator
MVRPIADRIFYPQGNAPHVELPVVGTGASTAPEPPELRRKRRLVLRLPDGRELPITGNLTVGQSSRNDVVLRDERVSRRHCVIELASGGVRVRDLNSTNGTTINGLRVTSADLSAGGVISIGRSQLRITFADEETPTLAGGSEPMRRLRGLIGQYAPTELGMLIVGETGTGKELVARALHEQSGRKGAFVAVNCGSIAKDLVESELFGHERGAFTGASAPRKGVFQEADGGTLFLDEVGELPLALQPRLLRALEAGTVKPVGADREVKVRVRVVAATHVDLAAAVARGQFRQDLYYRLAAAVVETPPLRARPSDLKALAERFLDVDSPSCRLTEAALARLALHRWPGNVRELRNLLKRAAALHGPIIDAQHVELEAAPVAAAVDEPNGVPVDGRPYLDIEREVLARAIQRYGGNKRAAANALRIPKSTLCDKARRYGIGDGA